ncbi:MAG: TonB-dependent receptor [Parvibaculaceae bacterium]|nr:TonB-dependent receptor [Parvibaculaceae bacterium]
MSKGVDTGELTQQLKRRRPFIGLALSAFFVTITLAVGLYDSAHAEQALPSLGVNSEKISYAIQPQSLGMSLTYFADRAGIKLLFPSELVVGKTSGGLSGSFTREQALDELLRGTGLVYRFTSAHTVTITKPVGESSVEGTQVLDTIVVVAPGASSASGPGYMGTPDWVYEKAAAVSVISREAIERMPVRNTADLFEGVAGVHTANNPQNPAVNVSMRGLMDHNRVASMIDGARQNFQREAHGTTDYVFVDPAMLRTVEIEKSNTSGVGSAGSLGGSVNFRTLGAEDIIAPGESFGSEVSLTSGNNAFHFSGSASVAAELSDRVSVLAVVSGRKRGDYKIGQNGSVERSNSTVDVTDGVDYTSLKSYSTLFKVEAQALDDLDLEASWLHFDSDFWYGNGSYISNDKFENDTITAKLHWYPDDPLINLKGNVWFNKTFGDQFRPQGLTGRSYGDYAVQYGMNSTGASLENTSDFKLPWANVSLNYGFEGFMDETDVTSQSLYKDASGNGIPAEDEALQNRWFAGYNPVGQRDVLSGFASVNFEHEDWLTASAGLRYDYYEIEGVASIVTGVEVIYTVAEVCGPGTPFPPGLWAIIYPGIPYPAPVCGPDPYPSLGTPQIQYEDVDVHSSGGRALPTATISVKPFEWLQPFIKYSEGYRPPTLSEAVMGGSHVGGGIDFYPNPNLKPEHTRTWEIGANIITDDLWFSGDHFRLKGVFFDRTFNNRIVLDKVSVSHSYTGPVGGYQHPASGIGDFVTGVIVTEGDGYTNVEGVSKTWGVELEAGYDAGIAYIGGAFTHMEPDTLSASLTPPKTKISVDGGVRLFDKKLNIGARLGYSSEDIRLYQNYQKPAYTKYDLYGSYRFSEKTSVNFAVDNLTDIAYVPPIGTAVYPAPGRTVTATLKLKF